jgi:Flp pilus assembly protein TadG
LNAPIVVRRASGSSCRGQSIVEFALVLPFLMVIVLGVTEVGYALLDSHIVTKLTRESSNLISRDTTLADAATAIQSMTTRPVNFNDGSSKIIFSVIKNVATTGAANRDKAILYQRFVYGSYPGTSVLSTAGAGSYGGAPNYQAVNSDNDTRLQVTNLPGGMTLTLGGTTYVTEIYTRHPLITPLDRFGVTVPQTLYSIAYF